MFLIFKLVFVQPTTIKRGEDSILAMCDRWGISKVLKKKELSRVFSQMALYFRNFTHDTNRYGFFKPKRQLLKTTLNF